MFSRLTVVVSRMNGNRWPDKDLTDIDDDPRANHTI